MHIYHQDTADQLAQAISLRIAAQLQERPDSLLCLAGRNHAARVSRLRRRTAGWHGGF